MIKKIIVLTTVLSLIFVIGCAQVSELAEGITGKSSQDGIKILREAKLAGEWHMRQMEIELSEEDEVSILMKLASGDKVDGYFYLEKGSDIDFKITGNSLVYESQVLDSYITSDRFSFVADDAQGDTYTFTFISNADSEQDKAKIFFEVIYPISASVFVPIANK